MAAATSTQPGPLRVDAVIQARMARTAAVHEAATATLPGDPPLTHIQICASWQSNDPATACDCDKQITPDADPLADTYGSRCDDDEVVA